MFSILIFSNLIDFFNVVNFFNMVDSFKVAIFSKFFKIVEVVKIIIANFYSIIFDFVNFLVVFVVLSIEIIA